MLERVRYVNSRGEVMDFGAAGIYVNENDLRNWEWSYETAYNRIRNLTRKPRTRSLPVKIWAETEAQGLALKNRLHDITEVDVAAGTPGRLYIGDWYQYCYVVESKKSNYLVNKCILDVTLTLAVDSGPWYCSQLETFGERTGLVSAVVGTALVGFAQVDASDNTAAEEGYTYPSFENFTVEGQTVQAGEGTPSPDNVRPITGAGMMDAMVILDGSADEAWAKYTTETVQSKSSVFFLTISDSAAALGSSVSSSFANTDESDINAWHAKNDGQTMIYTDHPTLARKYFRWGAAGATVADFRAWLAENPITLWYTKATHEEGDAYYAGVSTEKAGAYYGKGVEVARPLFEGDTLQTYIEQDGNARSRVTYKKSWLVLDGVANKFATFVTTYAMVQLPGLKANGGVVCSHLPSDKTTGVWLGSSGAAFMLAGLPATASDLASANAWLAAQHAAGTPVTLVYELAEDDVYDGDPVILVSMVDAYRYDYPRGYKAASGSTEYLVNDGVVACDWKMTIHGPAANPAITIGGNIHRLAYEIPTNCRAEIDSRKRTITLVDAAGTETNLFRYRDKDSDIFQRVAPGANWLRWNGEYTFSVELYKERSEPKWT